MTLRNVVPLEEMWRQCDIKGYEHYWISSHGRVKNERTNRELSPYDANGYLQVQLWDNRRAKYVYVHRLVASHFLTGWGDHVTIGWRDGDRANNHLENLYFKGDRRLGHVIEPRKTYQDRRIEIMETGQTFASVKAVAKFLQTSPQGIYQVLLGRRLTHLGYHFRWIDI